MTVTDRADVARPSSTGFRRRSPMMIAANPTACLDGSEELVRDPGGTELALHSSMQLATEPSEPQQLNLSTGHVWLDSDGILHAVVDAHVELGLEDAREWVHVMEIVGAGKRRPTLVDYGRMKSMSREARLYFSGPACARIQSATALVVSSPLGKAIGNFFMGLNKPLIPTKLFSDQLTALVWLASFR